MTKYVIDIDDSDRPQFIACYGTMPGGEIYVQNVSISDLEELTAEYVKRDFADLQETAYNNGQDEGRKWGAINGAEQAWELAKKISTDSEDGGYTCDELQKIFGTRYPYKVFEAHTVHEAFAKLKAYEEKKAQDLEIKIGDEVEFINDREGREGDKHIVSYTYGEKFDGIDDNGMTCKGCDIHDVRKTGKHYNIAELLKKMKEG